MESINIFSGVFNFKIRRNHTHKTSVTWILSFMAIIFGVFYTLNYLPEVFRGKISKILYEEKLLETNFSDEKSFDNSNNMLSISIQNQFGIINKAVLDEFKLYSICIEMGSQDFYFLNIKSIKSTEILFELKIYDLFHNDNPNFSSYSTDKALVFTKCRIKSKVNNQLCKKYYKSKEYIHNEETINNFILSQENGFNNYINDFGIVINEKNTLVGNNECNIKNALSENISNCNLNYFDNKFSNSIQNFGNFNENISTSTVTTFILKLQLPKIILRLNQIENHLNELNHSFLINKINFPNINPKKQLNIELKHIEFKDNTSLFKEKYILKNYFSYENHSFDNLNIEYTAFEPELVIRLEKPKITNVITRSVLTLIQGFSEIFIVIQIAFLILGFCGNLFISYCVNLFFVNENFKLDNLNKNVKLNDKYSGIINDVINNELSEKSNIKLQNNEETFYFDKENFLFKTTSSKIISKINLKAKNFDENIDGLEHDNLVKMENLESSTLLNDSGQSCAFESNLNYYWSFPLYLQSNLDLLIGRDEKIFNSASYILTKQEIGQKYEFNKKHKNHSEIIEMNEDEMYNRFQIASEINNHIQSVEYINSKLKDIEIIKALLFNDQQILAMSIVEKPCINENNVELPKRLMNSYISYLFDNETKENIVIGYYTNIFSLNKHSEISHTDFSIFNGLELNIRQKIIENVAKIKQAAENQTI